MAASEVANAPNSTVPATTTGTKFCWVCCSKFIRYITARTCIALSGSCPAISVKRWATSSTFLSCPPGATTPRSALTVLARVCSLRLPSRRISSRSSC
ncbi:hypothetical protein B723_18580 [Pseudomonas fluorescens NCIMB 11764]|uniref:Uncharacterized protein n=1 Tax=Pseudomonas fluorescens NCIMB 11764 TaxID=1221522 RepID=A0A0K1QS71_PSEFL|nr:hypothetical protein B723_18580 [Pseudomonas fluorescens NCIMB 11764]